MKLGTIQQKWVDALRAHPERQMKEALGNGSPKDYQCCCLGQLLCVYNAHHKKKLPFIDGVIRDTDGGAQDLLDSYKKLKLNSQIGRISHTSKSIKKIIVNSLAEANDGDYTWLEIADFIEKFPKTVFTGSI